MRLFFYPSSITKFQLKAILRQTWSIIWKLADNCNGPDDNCVQTHFLSVITGVTYFELDLVPWKFYPLFYTQIFWLTKKKRIITFCQWEEKKIQYISIKIRGRIKQWAIVIEYFQYNQTFFVCVLWRQLFGDRPWKSFLSDHQCFY